MRDREQEFLSNLNDGMTMGCRNGETREIISDTDDQKHKAKHTIDDLDRLISEIETKFLTGLLAT